MDFIEVFIAIALTSLAFLCGVVAYCALTANCPGMC